MVSVCGTLEGRVNGCLSTAILEKSDCNDDGFVVWEFVLSCCGGEVLILVLCMSKFARGCISPPVCATAHFSLSPIPIGCELVFTTV